MKEKIDLIILAAGIGNRFQKELPKQFFLINKIPVFIRTINTVINVKWLKKIILVINQDYEEHYFNFLKAYDIDMKKIKIVYGGDHRFDSIKNAISVVETRLVIIMEGARPFATISLYNKLVNNINDNVVTVVKPVNTGYIIKNGKLVEVIPTNTHVYSVSPKKYNLEAIKRVFENIDYSKSDEYELFKDDISKFDMVYSESTNIKITNPIDEYIANSLAKKFKNN